MPKFVYTKKYITYVVYIIAALVLMLFVKYNLTYYLVSPVVMPEIAPDVSNLTLNYAIQTMVGEFYVICFVTAIKITVGRLRENNRLYELEKRQLKTELRFLRTQVSPHFFFNTLNNIYSLTLEKSDKAPEVVLKLSELMRYLLYATKKRKQDLKKEVTCVQNYIDLERIRFDGSLKVNFNIEGDLDNCVIAPMLLIPIVENCFKHGANKNIDDTHIRIDLKIVGDFMHFRAVNTIPQKIDKKKKKIKAGGIGLYNIKKRLDLGYKKSDYELSIFEKDNMFNVLLKLKV
jgi:LytS/YehU family sensor histidine kinase